MTLRRDNEVLSCGFRGTGGVRRGLTNIPALPNAEDNLPDSPS